MIDCNLLELIIIFFGMGFAKVVVNRWLNHNFKVISSIWNEGTII